MLKSARRLSKAPPLDDVVHTADPATDDDLFDDATAAMADDLPTPTFFHDDFRDVPVHSLAQRYRTARDIPPEPPVIGRQARQGRPLYRYPVRAARYSHEMEAAFLSEERLHGRRPAARTEPDAAEGREPARRPLQPAVFLTAGVVALVIGGGLGLVLAKNPFAATSPASAAVASMADARLAPVTAVAPQTTGGRKSVPMAKLEAADVSGGLNSMIPLALTAEPTPAEPDIIVKLSGLPKSAYLTAGTRVSDSDWQLTPDDTHGVKLVVPRADQPSFRVKVAAVEAQSGELAAPPTEMTVAIASGTGAPAADSSVGAQIVPANSLPDTVKVIAPSGNSAAAPSQEVAEAMPAATDSPAEKLVSKGDILLKSGDLAMAREFYERAVAEGAGADAALGAGKTYDPVVYTALKVQGLQPDPQKALEWYERAQAAGSTQAAGAISDLKKTAP